MARLMFFGRFSDIISSSEMDLPDGIKSTEQLTRWLSNRYEGFQDTYARSGTRIAVNQMMVTENTDISNEDEIAYMSALSGG